MNQSTHRIPVLIALAAIAAAILASPASAKLGPGGAPEEPPSAKEMIIPGHYIVVFKDSVDKPGNLARTQVEQRDGELGFIYNQTIEGYSAELSKSDVEALRNDPRVKYITPDHKVQLASQEMPTGVKRVFAPTNENLDIDETDDLRVDVDVAVIDTGVDWTHPDLNVYRRTNCVPPGEGDYDTEEKWGYHECVDDSGTIGHWHGTHVAGTIGALDNDFGVVGTAPGARIWGVRVLNGGGGGSESWILEGVEWVTEHAAQIEVANMSLYCTVYPFECKPLEEAITASVEKGVVYVVAAGNFDIDAKYVSPAKNPNVITVSAIGDGDGEPGGKWAEGEGLCWDDGLGGYVNFIDDELASFSNWGSVVDVAAPGVCIRSTRPSGGYMTSSGTSMAAPHVSGVAAVMASESNPETKKDVETIRGLVSWTANTGWKDTSEDGAFERLLDLSDEEYFDPPHKTWAATKKASEVGVHKAKLNATLNPMGLETSYQLEWGTTASYGSKAPASPKAIGSGSKPVEVSETLSGLKPKTTYHYRVLATNSKGTTYGYDQTFTTSRGTPTFVLDFGSSGTGNTQFEEPTDIAVDGEGNLWVTDTGNDRIKKYDSKGNFKSTFSCCGSAKYGSKPMAIAVDSGGNLWITDTGNERVVKYSSTGTKLSEFGSEGSGKGQFKDPYGIAVDSKGDIWVVDTGNDRFQKFNSKGEFLEQISFSVGHSFTEIGFDSKGDFWVVDTGTECLRKYGYSVGGDLFEGFEGKVWIANCNDPKGDETFDDPIGVAVDPEGYVWVSEGAPEGDHRVQGFGPVEKPLWSRFGEYEFFGELGSLGSVKAKLDKPKGIAADKEGNIWVVDSGNDRIQKWVVSPDPPVASTKAASGVTSSGATLNATVNPNGLSTTYYFEYGATANYGNKVPLSPKSAGSGTEEVKVSETIGSLLSSDTYHYRVVATSAQGTVFGKDETLTTSAGGPSFELAFENSFEVQFGGPTGVASNGKTVWVADTGNNRVLRFNSGGTYMNELFEGTFQFKGPKDVGVNSTGPAWVADTGNHRFISEAGPKFGSFGSGKGQLNTPEGMGLDSAGNVWVADTYNHRIQKFSPTGTYLSGFGSLGTGNGQFKYPTDVAVDSKGNVWVADAINSRIQKLNSEGKYLSQFGSPGKGNGQFTYHRSIAIDLQGDVWVSDGGYSVGDIQRLQEFSAEGKFLGAYGTKGVDYGQFQYVRGISIDPNGDLWIADSGNNRVQKWDLP